MRLTIARQLTDEGFRSPHSSRVLPSTVASIRRRTGVYQKSKSRPVHVAGYSTISELAKAPGIRREWFRERISKGIIRIEKNAEHAVLSLSRPKEDSRRLASLIPGHNRSTRLLRGIKMRTSRRFSVMRAWRPRRSTRTSRSASSARSMPTPTPAGCCVLPHSVAPTPGSTGRCGSGYASWPSVSFAG